MNSLYTRPPPQSMRFMSSARRKSYDLTKGLTKPILTNEWEAAGVTNMCFDDDESDDVGHVSKNFSMNTNSLSRDRVSSSMSCDSGYDDGISPVTSPDVTKQATDVTSGLYHRAMSRRRSLVELENENSDKQASLTSGGTTISPHNLKMAPSSPPNSNGTAGTAPVKIQPPHIDEVFSRVTSLRPDVVQSKKGRSVSVIEMMPRDVVAPKPRSISQPDMKDISMIYYKKLEDISEEEVSIDRTGISRWVKRQDIIKESTENSGLVFGKDDLKSPLIDVPENLDEWQVKLGEKEPAKCRCDGKPAPPPPRPPTPSESYDSVEYVAGKEVSIGDSIPMTTEAPAEVEGIVTEFGTSREMSVASAIEVSPAASTTYSTSTGVSVDVPSASAGRKKKSLKSIFRLGFLTTKMRKKSRSDDSSIPSPPAGPQSLSPSKRLTQRRMSRLEMNEPIEDIFSEVKFETIPKRPSSADSVEKRVDDSAEDSDDDIIEDPEAIMRSIINDEGHRQNEQDNFLNEEDEEDFIPDMPHGTDDVILDHHDVIEPGNLEKELLLPEIGNKNCSVAPLCGENSTKVSEVDLR